MICQLFFSESREKAYIYAISSAGVMHAVTKACAKGDLHICSCDKRVRSQDTGDDFLWGGCSHNVKFGEKFAREFLDSKENSDVETGLMNLWNNGAGRKVGNRWPCGTPLAWLCFYQTGSA